MKKIIVLLLLTLSVQLYAQPNVEWGVKAGIQLSRFQGGDFNWSPPAQTSSRSPERLSTKTTPTFGYAVGGYVRGKEATFLQAEMLVSFKGANVDRFLADNSTKLSTTTLGYGQLDIPLSVGHKFKRWEITGGPMLSVTISDNGKLKELLSQYQTVTTDQSLYQTLTGGYHIGAGLYIGKMTLQLRYMGSIQNVVSQAIYYDDPSLGVGQKQSLFEQRSGTWQLTAGFHF